QSRSEAQIQDAAKGGYVLAKEKGELKAIIIATGSEVSIAMDAYAQLEGVRVVSMPCAELFMTQDAAYREAVLPASIRARVAVEAAHVDYWWKFVGLDGKVIGMTTYGESAPAKDLFQHFGITSQAVIEAVQSY
ncbi:transketolase-like TK C-terminal-containing protein, partial [Acinetobacter soli]